MKKISIILLIYNSNLNSILITLKSIMLQSMKEDIEIVIADDGSKEKWDKEIVDFLEKYGFKSYTFAPSKTNVGTVNNILRALTYCNGEYVKAIGAGDLLFSNNTLYNMYTVVKKDNCKCAFGNLQAFTLNKNRIVPHPFDAPIYKKLYLKNKIKKIRKNIVLDHDYISGASMIFERNYFRSELEKLSGIVKYAEDWIQVPIVLSGEMYKYVPLNFVLYEVGTGISTNKKGNERLKQDEEKFMAYIKSNYHDSLINILRKRDKLPKVLRSLVKWGMNPAMRLAFIVRRLKFAKAEAGRKQTNVDLGFLSEDRFIEEFGLKS